jgi:hypothetical protein
VRPSAGFGWFGRGRGRLAEESPQIALYGRNLGIVNTLDPLSEGEIDLSRVIEFAPQRKPASYQRWTGRPALDLAASCLALAFLAAARMLHSR